VRLRLGDVKFQGCRPLNPAHVSDWLHALRCAMRRFSNHER
jgi:hypothetical protein